MNYHLPPEWAKQSGVMLTWPHAKSDWQSMLNDVEKVYLDMARHIVNYEKLLITCFDAKHQQHITEILKTTGVNLTNIRFAIAESNDTWVRDHGPITVLNEEKPLLLNFQFNAWGDKYQSDADNRINTILHKQGAFDAMAMQDVDLILEGGSIETDGKGTLLTTEACLLAKTRNNTLERSQIEKKLEQFLGISRVLWLTSGYLSGDDTDSHIDTLARFTDANTICYVACDQATDPHYAPLKAMEQELRQFKNYRGEAYDLIALPWPQAKFDANGKRLAATYANFLIINDAVLVPTYDDPADEKALQQIRWCFPKREIIPVPCTTLIYQNGSLHCSTMQLPEGVLL